jgi:hypothetical protein
VVCVSDSSEIKKLSQLSMWRQAEDWGKMLDPDPDPQAVLWIRKYIFRIRRPNYLRTFWCIYQDILCLLKKMCCQVLCVPGSISLNIIKYWTFLKFRWQIVRIRIRNRIREANNYSTYPPDPDP